MKIIIFHAINIILLTLTFDIVESLVTDFIKDKGYPVQTFADIPTEDGYLLTMYRIPHGKNVSSKFRKATTNRPPVLLMHGLLATCFSYVVMGPERGLAFILADLGYDVWLGNARGTIYSRKHSHLDPDADSNFWAFSWHEIGVYDLPAMYKLILNVTGRSNLSYIGMSQGTTVFYVMASVKPEYNKFTNLMISLAPIAYMSHVRSSFVRFAANIEPTLRFLAKSTGMNEIFPGPIRNVIVLLAKIFCSVKGFFQDVCANLMWFTGGYDPYLFNKSIIPEILSEGPSGSVHQLLHYAQNIHSGQFCYYNYGREINKIKYGSAEPPLYIINNVVVPIALFHSEGDWFAEFLDVNKLYTELPNVVVKYIVPFKPFNHYDFLFATDVVTLVYNKLFHILNEYNNK